MFWAYVAATGTGISESKWDTARQETEAVKKLASTTTQ